MEFTGVYHKTSEQMSYPLDEDRLIVNIKTGYDVKQVFIHYGDPYEAGILSGNRLQNNTKLPSLSSVQNNIYIFYMQEKVLLSTRFDGADVFYK